MRHYTLLLVKGLQRYQRSKLEVKKNICQNQCLVPHLKDLLCICLEIKAQGFWMSFKVCNLGSKYPYFNRAYLVSGGFEWTHLYSRQGKARVTYCPKSKGIWPQKCWYRHDGFLHKMSINFLDMHSFTQKTIKKPLSCNFEYKKVSEMII